MNHQTRFSLIVALEIPAIFFSIVIFLHFAYNRQVRSKLKNHGWLILLIVNFVQLILDYPMSASYYYMGTIWPQTPAICIWWTWLEFSLNTVGLFLMTWISIQRHVFIFWPHAMVQNRLKKWLFHFLPIILTLMWTPLFYFVVIVISPHCSTTWDMTLFNCGYVCFLTANYLGPFDVICNCTVPIVVIMFANITLVIRVIRQKMSRQQGINWRRHRKMVVQLWLVSSLYMAFWMPLAITQFIQITVMPTFMADQLDTILFLTYFIPLLLPMICLGTLPELVKKIFDVIKIRRLNVVRPVGLTREIGQETARTGIP